MPGARAPRRPRRSSAGFESGYSERHEHEAVVGADRVAGERHPLEHERRVALHQVLVDVGAGVALVAVGDDELLLARGEARAKRPLVARPGSRRRRGRAPRRLDLGRAGSPGVCSASARASPDQSPGRGQHRLGQHADATRAPAPARVAPASTRSTTPAPASIESPSRTAGEEWQKPRQTVSASETRAVVAALAERQPERRRAARSTCASPVAAKQAVPVQTRTWRAPARREQVVVEGRDAVDRRLRQPRGLRRPRGGRRR